MITQLTVAQLHQLANAFGNPWPYGSRSAPESPMACADVRELDGGYMPDGQRIAVATDSDGSVWALIVWVEMPPTAEDIAAQEAYRKELERMMNPKPQPYHDGSNETAEGYE